MKFLFTFVFALIVSFASISCQEIEDPKDEAELIPPLSTPSKDGDNPITSITTTVRNGTMSIFTRIADKVSNTWNRIRNHMQERYQKTMERLQRRAVDAMERLQEYVKKRMDDTTDATTKEYLERLNSGIQQITDQLRNLMTSVESKVDEASGLDFRGRIPAYKIDP